VRLPSCRENVRDRLSLPSTYGAFGPDASRPVWTATFSARRSPGAVHRRGAGAEERHAVAARGPDPPRELARGVHPGLWEPTGFSRRFTSGPRPEGQAVDLSGAESLMMFADYNITWMHTGGKARERVGTSTPPSSRTLHQVPDGYTFIAAYNDEAFDSLMHIIGRPELAATRGSRRPKTGSLSKTNVRSWRSSRSGRDRTADEILGAVEEYTSKRGARRRRGHGAGEPPLETLSEEHWRREDAFCVPMTPSTGNCCSRPPPGR